MDRRGGVMVKDLGNYLGLYSNEVKRLMAQCGIFVKPRTPLTMAQVEKILLRLWFNRAKHKGFRRYKR